MGSLRVLRRSEDVVRVLAASVTNRAPDVLGPHLASLKALNLPRGVTLDFAYISDAAPPESERLLHEAGVRVATAYPKTSGEAYAITETTHEWNLPTFAWLAREKQRLLDLAVEERYDAIFFVDSDLVLSSDTLASLIAARKPVVSAVFWTRWVPDAPPMPQVWLQHPYGMAGRSGVRYLDEATFLRRLAQRELVEVLGLGACTLIAANVIPKVPFFPLLEGLPSGGMWQGEDRSFCIRAQQAHVPLWADAWPDVLHLYRPSDVAAFHDHGWAPPARREIARFGDFVSFTLETLEELEVIRMDRREHVRGRIGALKVLPEIEAALLTTRAGDERIIRVTFPAWWSLPEYRGKTKSILLRMLDVKDGCLAS